MKKKIEKQRSKSKNKFMTNLKWSLQLMLVASIISVLFSFVAEIAMKDVSLMVGIIIILTFIGIGILFDTIGVAVTSADEAIFHSMSSKKVKGAKLAVKLKKNSNKVSSFCCDVIGDICGIISGSAGVLVATKMASILNVSALLSNLIVTGLIAALTIGGKAFEKYLAITNGSDILYCVAKMMSIFSKD